MQNHTECPGDEILMDFLEQRLAAEAREQVEHHLAHCAGCREQVAVCADLLGTASESQAVPVPPQVTQRAVDAVLEQARATWPRKLGREARQWVEKGAAALERWTLGAVPVPVPVRSRSVTPVDAVIRRERQLVGLKVSIEIAKSGPGRAVIRVAGDPAPPDGILVRAALFKEAREIASGVLGRAPLMLEEIAPGVYTLVFSERARELGQYTFEIVDET
jgi:hypothetical protein